jgi:NAD(P)-dependent dehydrogenase (short-subunit alcohol dehydrogenase family)
MAACAEAHCLRARAGMRLKTKLVLGAAAILAARSVMRRRRRMDFRDRVVAITGGSRGLGLILAHEFARRGARVAICARDGDELERARVELSILGGTVHTAICDVTNRDDVIEFLASTRDELGPIDVLVNNAGIIQVGPIELMAVEDYERAVRTHLFGPLYAMRDVIPEMRARKSGRIVNIASIGAKLAVPHLAPYSASKFALYGLSAAAHAELAKDNIFVTTVCPGLMRTGSTGHAFVKGQHQAEFAWFDVLDNLPITSMSAERAGKQIVRACEYGDAEVTLSLQAKLAATLHGIAPSFMQDLLSVVSRVLPAGGSSRAIEGRNL